MAVIQLVPAAAAAAAPPLHFGPYTLLPRERRLLRGQTEVPLGPRAFDVLHVLAARPGQLVTKDELLGIVWRGLVVEEANLHVQVSQLRKAIGADAIVTVPGLGYRFAAPAPERAPAAPASRRLSVIVLPFVENGAPPEQDYFADAITDDVTTQLSKIKGATVIGSQTALAFKRQTVDVPALARELGVRYVLQGRIERGESSVEVNARLSDAATGAVIWSDLVAAERHALREIRRELVGRLAVALDQELQFEEARRVGRGAASPAAQDLVLQARALSRNWSQAEYERALALAEQALVLEPESSEALALRASLLALLAAAFPGPRLPQQLERAEADALHALSIDALDIVAWRSLSVVRQQQYRLDEALEAVDTALEINPNDPRSQSWRGYLLLLSARSDLALGPLQRALRVSPHDPHRWMTLLRLGAARIYLGEHAKAQPWLEQAWALQQHWQLPMHRAAVFARLGEPGRAFELRPQLAWDDGSGPRRWSRVSRDPAFLLQVREQLHGPVVECGVLEDFSFFEAWAARQRRGGI